MTYFSHLRQSEDDSSVVITLDSDGKLTSINDNNGGKAELAYNSTNLNDGIWHLGYLLKLDF